MEKILLNFFVDNWQRKLVALLAAISLWVFVNHSIIATKTIPNIAIRIINIPATKTIQGLLPNGILDKRITLTLSGSKDVIEELEPGDLEVLLDVSTVESDQWIVQISKKNLVSLNPATDLTHHITQVDHTEFILKLSNLVTEKVPITITTPTGKAPEGYEFLDIWPQRLTQTLSGPEEDIKRLKMQGLELTFDLNDVSKTDLDQQTNSNSHNTHDDEISYFIPNKWKKVGIPFQHNVTEQINDPDAKNLRIDFLRKKLFPINSEIPIKVFYPVKFSDTLNPQTYPLVPNKYIRERNGITLLDYPLYVRDVSKLFLDIIRENMQISLIAAPKSERERLHWNVEINDPKELEDTYVAYLIGDLGGEEEAEENPAAPRKQLLRRRFRNYMQRLRLYAAENQKLKLLATLKDNKIDVTVQSPNRNN